MTRSRRLPGGGPGLIRMRGAGFLLLPAYTGLRPLPGRAGSYMISAGVSPICRAGSRPSGGTWIYDAPVNAHWIPPVTGASCLVPGMSIPAPGVRI